MFAAAVAMSVVAAATVAACGGGGSKYAPPARQATTATTSTQPATAPSRRARPQTAAKGSRGVTIRAPRGWSQPRPRVSSRRWPTPLAITASFRVRHASANDACPADVLSRMPPDGVYIVVAEYTEPRPAGFPPHGPLVRRGDLRHLDIRPSEIECWEGPSGTARFTDHGRAFYVEVLLGRRVTPQRRQQALDTLASMRVTGSG